jgi:alpha-galactosidase
MNRRIFLAAPFGLAAQTSFRLKDAPGTVIADGDVQLMRDWSGDFCKSRIVNRGASPVRVREVVLFSLRHSLPPETEFYGESFQMLSQFAGTLGKPVELGYNEVKHYRIPGPLDATVATGMIALGDSTVLAFSSCRRFLGRSYLRPQSIDVVLDMENLILGPGETWELEEFFHGTGSPRARLLEKLATQINQNHKPLAFAKPPTGWCSWYCFGPRVTAKQVLDNLDVISKDVPALRYVQIDDGYQPAMGDWLETGNAFGGDIQGVLKEIRKRGFEPAIWVAPFIAEAGSHVFQQHPEWFMKGSDGKPLSADKVTFQGWRRPPWYALDGTHPEAQEHLEKLFRTMRNEWGCTYFKLDANFWGAMHSARLHDPKATRIEAYRRGMQAILRGSGDGFILGCNHPIWPSFGLIHGSRSSADINRRWTTFVRIARQNLCRNWQNGRLWWNDPDAVVLTGDLPENEFIFHATSAYASGGMVLSGDDLTKIPAARLAMLKKLLPPTGVAAEFEDGTLRIGWIRGSRNKLCVFNWSDQPATISARLPRASRLRDFWSGADLGRQEGVFEIKDMPAHSARLLELA